MPPRRAARARGWCFTLPNYTDEEIETIKNIEHRFLIFGREKCPTTGTHHLQGFIHFVNGRSFQAVKRAFPERTHLEASKGSVDQNIEYCSKEDSSPFVSGTAPVQGKRNDLVAFVESCKETRPTETELIESFTNVYARYPRFVHKVLNHYHQPGNLAALDNYWYFGEPGTGKSHTARTKYPEHYAKSLNKWWDNYTDQATVIIDEVVPNQPWLMEFLKIWGDKYPFQAEIKGEVRVIRPVRIIVTSNWTIEECVDSVRLKEALARRFEVVHFTTKYVAPTI